MEQTDWKNWCRLCGKKNGSEVDATLKLEHTENLGVSIRKYFGIVISEESNFGTKICIGCNDTINSIIKYNTHVLKVNEMFLKLERSYLHENINLESLRKKYGLNNNINGLCDSEMYAPDFCLMQVKVHVKSKTEAGNNSSPPSECFLKTKNVDVDDIDLENSVTFFEESNDVLSNDYDEQKKIKQDSYKNGNGDDNINLSKDIEIGKSEEKIVECNICQKRFVTVRGRTLHMRQKHIVDIHPPPYNCHVCGKIFKRMHLLKSHEVVHLPETERNLYDCSQCQKKFKSERNLQYHIRVVHKKDGPFICELCGSAFGYMSKLQEHLLTHSDERKCKCPRCEKTFKCDRDLKVHIDIHDGTEYICKICGLKLNTRRILRRHMIVHSDQNKYKCNFCSKQFKRPDAFKNHLILHTGLKPYECSFCELTFANGSNCRKHLRTTHPLELAAAELKGKQKFSKNVPSIKQLKAVNKEALLEINS